MPNNKTVMFDVDDTLVLWNPSVEKLSKDYPTFTDSISDKEVKFYGHLQNIKYLIQYAIRGYNVIVWSKAGSDWADMAVRGLGIEQYVDLTIPKPDFLVDDLPLTDFLPDTTFLKLDMHNKDDLDFVVEAIK